MMSKSTSWRWLTAVSMLMTALIAGCQGESPTSPPTVPGPNPPVSNPVITITISNRTPAAGQSTLVEVTATKDGQNVPDGTPVEFLTSLGEWKESGLRSLFMTTVGGKAVATLTSTTSGTAEIAVRVLETIKRDSVVFGEVSGPGVTVVLTVSDANPSPGQTVTVTATVSQDGVLVANGTVVKFSTNFGVFTDTQTQVATRTTTAGVATVQVTSAQGGEATVTARAETATGALLGQSSTKIVFGGTGIAPTITSITPSSGPPSGNTQVTIKGTNFRPPVRVFFDTKEAAVVSVSDTEIVVLTPSIDMGATTPSREVTVTVVNEAGTPAETSVTATQRFTFTIPILTPVVYGVSPSSGPNEGNTQITITGDSFQSPVKVFFSAQGEETEVEVKHVTFNQIVAVTPPALGLGAHLQNQTVTVRVVNLASNKSVSFSNGFRYGPGILITGVSPLQGSTQGGTQVTILGYGFDDPVAVTIGGIVAQPTEVTGTRIVAITGTPLNPGCANVSGPITVTNLETGETADAENLQFTFIAPRPTFVSLTPNPVAEGAAETIVIEDAGSGLYRFQIGGITVVPSATSVNGDLTTFTVTAPLGLNFTEIRCGTNNLGRQFAPFVADVSFTNLTTGCSVTLADALVVNPTNLACRFANASPSTTAITINDSVAGTGGTNATFTMSNTGQHDLTASPSITSSCATGSFAIAPTGTSTIPPGSSQVYTVTFTATAVGPCTATITWTTNDPDPSNPPTTITVSGNGTP